MAATGGNIPGTGGATGGSPQTGGSKASGGTPATGGSTATGGVAPTGGTSATGGGAATGGKSATGGAGNGGAATGGKSSTGGAATGGAATGGKAATGGSATAATGGSAAGGAAAAGGPNCSATMPTGGNTQPATGSTNSLNGTADGLNYGIWSNGSGGNMTTFANAHAFSASWNNGGDFLAHLGLDMNSKNATAYTSIVAQFVESRTGTAGGYSSVGMYGWTQSPCVEWYIVEDSFQTMPTQKSSVTTTVDGGTYYLISNQTTGSGGNACESGHTGGWTQMWSVRTTARQCGTITVSDHFAKWAAQGWSLGKLTSVHINVEVGGGVGSIQFPVANVTAN
jgi:hypothetical protein